MMHPLSEKPVVPGTGVVTAASSFPHSLSVFFPAYNDAPSLPALVGKTFEVLEELVEDFEVIIVDDGSADETRETARRLQRFHGSRLKVITHEINRGYGGALRSGFEAAGKEFVFYTDGDGQYDIGELPKLLSAVADGVGLVNGWKVKRRDPRHRIWIGKAYNGLARWLFHVNLRDIDCDFRLIRGSLLRGVTLKSDSGAICVELVKRIEASGACVVEIPVQHYPRVHGRSQFFRVLPLIRTFAQLLELYWNAVLGPAAVMGIAEDFDEQAT